MTNFKILEFKKSQYTYEAIEKDLSEKYSAGWKVISMHTDVSTDLKGIVVVLLQQIIPGEEETMSYEELIKKKEAELALKKIQKEIDNVDNNPYALSLMGSSYQTSALGGTSSSNGFFGENKRGMASVAAAVMATRFCTNCGAEAGKGKFCANCGNPL